MKQKVSIKKIRGFLQGWFRYYFYYSKNFKWVLPKHVFEQIAYRIMVMNPTCYYSGACIKCGCATPALQMMNGVCDGDCYPQMMGKKEWNAYKEVLKIVFNYKDGRKDFKIILPKERGYGGS